jgi:hypothetical protein
MDVVDHHPGVVRWRREQLRRAGVPMPLAERLAYDRQMDLHALIQLVERGCPPQTAARILRPLDEVRCVR